jgi:hypothetical protein
VAIEPSAAVGLSRRHLGGTCVANVLVSDDAGLMTGAIVNFDQSVWGAVPE